MVEDTWLWTYSTVRDVFELWSVDIIDTDVWRPTGHPTLNLELWTAWRWELWRAMRMDLWTNAQRLVDIQRHFCAAWECSSRFGTTGSAESVLYPGRYISSHVTLKVIARGEAENLGLMVEQRTWVWWWNIAWSLVTELPHRTNTTLHTLHYSLITHTYSHMSHSPHWHQSRCIFLSLLVEKVQTTQTHRHSPIQISC